MVADSTAASDLVRRIREAHTIPTWEDAPRIVPLSPNAGYEPYAWRWEEMRSLLLESGIVVKPGRGSERRSIDHVNPTLPAESLSTTHAVGTAFQLVRPGEIAPAHRHAAAAIRFAFESGDERIYTKVNGERLTMKTGDLLLTPSGTWHDHYNESDHDIIWFDALDYPLVNFLRASYFEPYTGDAQPDRFELDYSAAHIGLVRPAFQTYEHAVPVVRYPWTDVEDWLRLARRQPPDPYHGYAMTYAAPFGPGSPLPTLGCYVQSLPQALRTRPVRATASRAQLVLQGEGETIVEGVPISWRRGDVLSLPPWKWVEHRNGGQEEARFFVVSEQPLLETLGLYRTETRSAAEDGAEDPRARGQRSLATS